MRTYFTILCLLLCGGMITTVVGQKVRFRGAYDIPSGYIAKNTVFGGISGISYDPQRDVFLLVSDDRSNINPARYYESHIITKDMQVVEIRIDTVLFFKDAMGSLYPKNAVDFESIRSHPSEAFMIVGNEGGRPPKPSVSIYRKDGVFSKYVQTDSAYNAGQRENKSFEGLDFSADKKSVVYVTEGPLWADGDEPNEKHGALLRIRKQGIFSGTVEQEILYHLEKFPQTTDSIPPKGEDAVDNGVSELVVLDDHHLLVLERSGAYRGTLPFTLICKLFLVKVIRKKKKDGTYTYYAKKKEIFDFSNISPSTGRNVEGMTLGPNINGKRSLWFVSDNNFLKQDPTTFYWFEIN